MTEDLSDLAPLLERMAGRRVLVHGDLVADEFVLTTEPRVSREAPVLILRYRESRHVPGGAANAAANVAALGGVPVVLGEVGGDEAGRQVLDQLEGAGADVASVLVHEGHATPVKSRILAGDVNVARQQVVRIDRIDAPPRTESFLAELKARAVTLIEQVDGVLVSDYDVGFVDPASVGTLLLDSPARSGKPVALDSRHRLFDYPGVDVATPSEPELEAALDRRVGAPHLRELAAREALARLRARCLVLTRGAHGLEVVEDGHETRTVPAFGSDDVTDVTGAGDTVIAALVLALSAGASYVDAARLANAAAGLVVMKLGTATVSAAELHRAIAG